MGRYHALKPSHLYIPPHSATPQPSVLSFPSLLPPDGFSASVISPKFVGQRIPGFRISAAFLSSLHSNIFIELDSNYDCVNDFTHYGPRPARYDFSRPSSISSMSSLSASDVAPPEAFRLPDHSADDVETEDVQKESFIGEDGLPILRTFLAEDDQIRIEAMQIIADSVAQQRNTGSRALIFHPVSFLILAVALAFLKQIYTENGETNWIMIGTTSLGVIMSLLGGVRLLLGPYIFEAERVGTWKWLKQGRSAEEEEESGYRALGDQDEIMVTRFGDEFIGAIIFRGVQPIAPATSPTTNKRTRRAQSPSKHTKTVIRGWSVRQKYRRKEVGSALLEDAIKFAAGKDWTVDGVEFADDHANHKRVLPTMFNGALDQFTKIAQKTLDKKMEAFELEQGKGRKRK